MPRSLCEALGELATSFTATVTAADIKTTLNLDDELIRRGKRMAAERGTTLTALVEAALRAELTGPALCQPFVLHLPTVRGDRPPVTDPADRDAFYDVMEDDGATR